MQENTDRQFQRDIESCGQRAETESQGCDQASGLRVITETGNTNNEPVKTNDLLEAIIDRKNLNEACRRVVANGGAGGVDAMTVHELPKWLEENYDALQTRLRAGKYKPSPVQRVEIPKPEKGATRKLGIPTVVDRMIQQAIVQVLTPLYNPYFQTIVLGLDQTEAVMMPYTRCKK